jgi:8-oxo-dGTP pyrophosphatase MutT (NUDIX family)
MEGWVYQLEQELKKPLPGLDAQLRMAPEIRHPVNSDRPLRDGGVMILVYPHDCLWHTVFIKRTEYDGIHSGQVSFPGGIYEDQDITLVNTALRETREETGLPVSAVTVIGQLSSLLIPVSHVNVHTFVGRVEYRPAFRHDPAEVQYLIEVSLEELLNEEHHKTGTMTVLGRDITVPYFDIQGNRIWGATAMILSEFLEVVKNSYE